MTNTRRVVVTGIGLVSSLGIGTEPNWAALCAGQSGIARITKFDAAQFATRIAGEVKDFDPLRFIEKKDVKKMDAFIQYAIAASQFAMEDASLTVVDVLPRESYAGGHIPGAVSLPLAEIEARARQVLPDLAAEIAVYCAKFT